MAHEGNGNDRGPDGDLSSGPDRDGFRPHLDRWGLTPDGATIVTPSSRLLPVRCRGEAAMLKVATHEEERRGAAAMTWWGGRGAARVLAHLGDAILLERIEGPGSLGSLAGSGTEGDDEASRVLCAVAARLHGAEGRPPPPAHLPDLRTWFRALTPGAGRHGGRYPLLRTADRVARRLLDDARPRDVVLLHGDLHHGNVLDAGPRGWLAIDPKGIVGDRAFDYANLFRNPDPAVATHPGRLARQADVVAQAAALDRERLIGWVVALCGLSAAWHLEDGAALTDDLALAALALAELGPPHDP